MLALFLGFHLHRYDFLPIKPVAHTKEDLSKTPKQTSILIATVENQGDQLPTDLPPACYLIHWAQ